LRCTQSYSTPRAALGRASGYLVSGRGRPGQILAAVHAAQWATRHAAPRHTYPPVRGNERVRTSHDQGTPRWASLVTNAEALSGESGLRLGYIEPRKELLSVCSGAERIILGLDAYKLGLEINDTLLETPHLGDESGVRPADVTEKRLRH
jgi:hypothetical protein